VQETVLNEAASTLWSGGKMLYVTCTVSRWENEGVVESFLQGNPSFALENIKDHIPEWGLDLVDDQGFFRTFPHIHDMDGFFAALFRKK
jgi:16S rRNA (cytosine967-C5)-methyltransferase